MLANKDQHQFMTDYFWGNGQDVSTCIEDGLFGTLELYNFAMCIYMLCHDVMVLYIYGISRGKDLEEHITVRVCFQQCCLTFAHKSKHIEHLHLSQYVLIKLSLTTWGCSKADVDWCLGKGVAVH